MTDQSQGEPTVPLEERIAMAEATPTSNTEETPIEEKQVEPVTAESTPVVTEDTALENAKNPDRTREYIERLKQERDEAIAKSQFNTYQRSSSQQTQPQPPVVQQDVFNEDGEVDVAKLNQSLLEARQRAEYAESQSKQTYEYVQRMDEERQLQDAITKYPQLGLGNKEYDPDFESLAKALWVQKNYVDGQKTSYADAAKFVAGKYAPQFREQKVAQEAVQQYKTQQEVRQQGPVAPGKGEVRVNKNDIDDLKRRARSGDNNAIALLLDMTGY